MTDLSTQSCQSAEEAREIAASSGGPVLVLAPETLEQIRAAEEAGGFEGGMSGGTDGGFSAEGNPGAQSSDSDVIVLEGHDIPPGNAGAWLESGVERALDLKDVIEAIRGVPLGPVLLVPMRELQRLVGQGPADEA